MFLVGDMQNLIDGANVKVILVGRVKLNGQQVLLLECKLDLLF